MDNRPYTSDFYRKQAPNSHRSAAEIVPFVIGLLQPKSVIDVGCGIGTWLSVFKDHGVEDVLGVDGGWVDPALLKIPPHQFASFDLEKPFRLDRQFELAMSVEVAEHLPAECAETFVGTLVRLAPIVLFSAAIPGQGGAHHVNEQWPDYWTELFSRKGYAAADCLRKKIWRNENVDWWYAQNLLVFARTDFLTARPALQRKCQATPAALVHPKKYLELIEWIESLALTARDIETATLPGELFILVDEGVFGNLLAAGRRPMPFPEVNGAYGGPPVDDASAIREVERLRELGAGFMVFTRQAFWWLEYYADFNRHLHSKYRRVIANERLRLFDLRT